MLSLSFFGRFTFFDPFALFVTCFTVFVEDVEDVDCFTVSEACELTGGVADARTSTEAGCIAVSADLPFLAGPPLWMFLPPSPASVVWEELGSVSRLLSTLLNAS